MTSVKVELDVSLDELGRIVSLLKKWRKPRMQMNEQERLMSMTNKIEAIRMVRARLGLGLKEAKDLVEGASCPS